MLYNWQGARSANVLRMRNGTNDLGIQVEEMVVINQEGPICVVELQPPLYIEDSVSVFRVNRHEILKNNRHSGL